MTMASFLIDRNSPIRSGTATKLRHRSRYSESESFSGDQLSTALNDDGLLLNGGKGDEEDIVDHEAEGSDGSHARERKSVKSKSMLGYFMTELTRDYKLEGDASEFVERRDRVYTSVNTPKNLEKFCAFGFLQCLDSILYMVTFLPLRIIVAIFRVMTYPCAVVFMGNRRMLDGSQICDLLKGVILVVSCCITSYMDMSIIYHIVRRQSIIKFYVFYNMLDVMDKLVSGFGQDILDSLYWTAVEPRGRRREHFGTIFHLLFAIAYVVIHTVMILIQAIILNVAFNSHNKSLLTIMMSNNFVEIKGNLFKRLDKNNLCQITYSDIKERFHYLVLLLFVFIRNMKDMQWSWDSAFPIIQDAVVVILAEVIVDWIKHAFLTKFNELSASSYADFALGLAQDIASSQKKHAFTNFSDQVCRRMGFTPMPLICLLFMVCSKSFNISGPMPWLLVFLFYLCLMSTKVLNSIILLGWAQRLLTERTKTAKSTGTVVNSQVIPKKEEKAATKSKAETILENPIPVIITSRPITVSSSIAVNTDSTMSMDSADSVTRSNLNSESASLQTGEQSRDQQKAVFVNYDDQDISATESDRFAASSNEHFYTPADFSPVSVTEIYSQNPPSEHLPSSGNSCEQNNIFHPIEASVTSSQGEEIPETVNATSDFLVSNQSLDDSLSSDVDHSPSPLDSPETQQPGLSPAHLPLSPKLKHDDSGGDSFQEFFNEVLETTQQISLVLSPPAAAAAVEDNICIDATDTHQEGNHSV